MKTDESMKVEALIRSIGMIEDAEWMVTCDWTDRDTREAMWRKAKMVLEHGRRPHEQIIFRNVIRGATDKIFERTSKLAKRVDKNIQVTVFVDCDGAENTCDVSFLCDEKLHVHIQAIMVWLVGGKMPDVPIFERSFVAEEVDAYLHELLQDDDSIDMVVLTDARSFVRPTLKIFYNAVGKSPPLETKLHTDLPIDINVKWIACPADHDVPLSELDGECRLLYVNRQ